MMNPKRPTPGNIMKTPKVQDRKLEVEDYMGDK